MTLAEVDATLARFGAAIDVMTANLLDLEADPTNKLLDPVALAGTTATQVAAARQTLASLWDHFAAFKEVVARARTLRGDGPRVPPARLAELEALLHGPSVALPPIDVPLAQRGLYTPGQTTAATTPDQLLTDMAQAFELAKRVVVTVDGIWRAVLPRLETLGQVLATARRQAAELGEADPVLARAGELFDRVAAVATADPLAVPVDELDRMGAALAAARERLQRLADDRDSLGRDLEEADATVGRIVSLIDDGAAALHQARIRIVAPDGLLAPLEPTCVSEPERGLRPWLDRLRRMAAAGQWRDASRGLERWRQLAAQTEEAAARVVTANQAPVASRDELRGRLDAFAAKAERLGLTEDPEITARREQARAALWTAPTDLVEAAALVARFGATLAGTSREVGP